MKYSHLPVAGVLWLVGVVEKEIFGAGVEPSPPVPPAAVADDKLAILAAGADVAPN